MKEVLNGGYKVHPVPPPNSEIKERITKRYERERIKIEKLLTLGYTDRIGSKPMNFMLEILSRIGLEIERE